MSSYDEAVSEVNATVFLTLAKCGHVVEIIKNAQSGSDITRIVGQLEMIEDQTQDIQRKIAYYQIKESEVSGGLIAIINVTKHSIKPDLNKLKFNAKFNAFKGQLDEWLPRIESIATILEKTNSIAQTYRKKQ